MLESREQRNMEAINIIIISSAVCYIRENGVVGKVSTHSVDQKLVCQKRDDLGIFSCEKHLHNYMINQKH